MDKTMEDYNRQQMSEYAARLVAQAALSGWNRDQLIEYAARLSVKYEFLRVAYEARVNG